MLTIKSGIMLTDYKHIITQYQSKTILVIGDFILDTYIKGYTKRVSPEAPVPVVDVSSVNNSLGGAANVAANLQAMGARVEFCSVIGMDEAAERGFSLLESMGISTHHIIASKCKSTQAKTRVLSGGQTIVRYDQGDVALLDKTTEQHVIRTLEEIYSHCDAIIIADYEKGMITPAIIEAIERIRKQHPTVFLAVDSKRLHVFAPLHPDLVKPNFEEAQKLLNKNFTIKERFEALKNCGAELYQSTHAKHIALTIDEEGSLWFRNGVYEANASAGYVAHPQVSGAGDTFISTATLSMICNGDITAAVEIATIAAGIVVRKEDTAFCSSKELQACLNGEQKYHYTIDELKDHLLRYKAEGKKIVFTNGCFDILHSGHIYFLQKAKQQGEILIAGINTDESVSRLKGPSRPVNCLSDRIEVLAAIGCIDHIVSFGSVDDDTPISIIQQIKPDVFVKGSDYLDKELPESSVLEQMQVRVCYVPLLPAHSTTHLINRVRQNMEGEIPEHE
jgi:D-beta-D-heptose 7-phosphate kinase/D-beta-D-heptose 1-phosphate adenosyltransferase